MSLCRKCVLCNIIFKINYSLLFNIIGKTNELTIMMESPERRDVSQIQKNQLESIIRKCDRNTNRDHSKHEPTTVQNIIIIKIKNDRQIGRRIHTKK